jgi:hypothetical protein
MDERCNCEHVNMKNKREKEVYKPRKRTEARQHTSAPILVRYQNDLKI